MSNWKYKIDIKEGWKKAERQKISSFELATILAKKLEALPVSEEEKDLLSVVVKAFNEVTDIESFDSAMDSLYNWGDQELPPFDQQSQNKMCQIICRPNNKKSGIGGN